MVQITKRGLSFMDKKTLLEELNVKAKKYEKMSKYGFPGASDVQLAEYKHNADVFNCYISLIDAWDKLRDSVQSCNALSEESKGIVIGMIDNCLSETGLK